MEILNYFRTHFMDRFRADYWREKLKCIKYRIMIKTIENQTEQTAF